MSPTEPVSGPADVPPAAPYGAPTSSRSSVPGASEPVPPAVKRSLFRRWWFWAVIAVVLIGGISVAAGGDRANPGADPAASSGASAEESAEDQAPEEDGEAAPEEQAAEEAPAVAAIGERVAVDGFEVLVAAVEPGLAAVGEEPLSEQAQGAFTLVTVEVTNTGASAESVLSSSFTVRDAEGRTFEASPTAAIYLQGEGFAFEQINPGNTASGVLVFDIPAGVAAQSLDFSAGFLGESVTISLG